MSDTATVPAAASTPDASVANATDTVANATPAVPPVPETPVETAPVPKAAARRPAPPAADLPPGIIPVMLKLTPRSVAALREAGFLAAGPVTTHDVAVAVHRMLAMAWWAGVRADGGNLPARPVNHAGARVEPTAKELSQAAWLEKMSAVNEMETLPPV